MWLMMVHAAGSVAAAEWLAATLGSGDVTAGGADACNDAYDDAQSDNDEDEPADVLETILGHVDHCEDTSCDDHGVDVSVGVDVVAVVRVGRCQSRCWSRYLSSCRSPPPHFPRLSFTLTSLDS